MGELYERELPVLPGAGEAVARIAARWPLGLASSSNREIIDRVLETAGWTGPLRGQRLLGGGRRAASPRPTSTSRPRGGSTPCPDDVWPSRTRARASARRRPPASP